MLFALAVELLNLRAQKKHPDALDERAAGPPVSSAATPEKEGKSSVLRG